jgi:hypothetical protein
MLALSQHSKHIGVYIRIFGCNDHVSVDHLTGMEDFQSISTLPQKSYILHNPISRTNCSTFTRPNGFVIMSAVFSPEGIYLNSNSFSLTHSRIQAQLVSKCFVRTCLVVSSVKAIALMLLTSMVYGNGRPTSNSHKNLNIQIACFPA